MKEEIIICARDVYLEAGFNGFSMRKVAACAGISATAIYRHFPDKESLLFNILLAGFRLFAVYLKRCEKESSPLMRLQRSSREYMNFALENPGYYEIMFMSTDQMTGLKHLNDKGAQEMEETYLFHKQLVIDCQFKGQDTEQLTAAIWAFGHGLVALYLVGKLPLDKKTFMDMYTIQINNYLSYL
ncbi:MAG: TetR/AcrR family transcriptional regulator [Gammaproteobacteria bacterium]